MFDEVGEVAVVDVVMPTRKGVTIRKRCVVKPTPHQKILLQRLGLRAAGFARGFRIVVKTLGEWRCKEKELSTQLRKLG